MSYLKDRWSNFIYGLKNLIRWLPYIWEDRDWDWIYLARLMRFKIVEMACHFDEYGHHVDSDKCAKQMRICSELLRRMEEQPYYDNADARYPGRKSKWAQHIAMQEKQDDELLSKLLSKHMRSWWD